MIKNINRSEFKHYGEDADWLYESAKEFPEAWTRCEICGKPLYVATSIYCENGCRSKKYAITEEERKALDDYDKDTDEVKLCFDCYHKGCPICGSHDMGR